MHLRGNPVKKGGARNIDCPYYSDCLGHAAKNFWQRFSCSECPNRSEKLPVAKEFYEVHHPLVSHELPNEIIRAIGD
jgi:hypothetical protein